MKNVNELLNKEPRSVTTAENEKAKLEEIKISLSERLNQIESEIKKTEAEAGKKTLNDALNNGNSADKALEKLSQLESEKRAKVKALALIDELYPTALKNLWIAQAAEKRAEAIKLRSEAAERLKTVNPLLAQLKEFEKVDFAPVRPDYVHINPGQGGAPTIQVVRISVTQGLIQQAERLEAIAEGLQRQSETGDIEPKIIWDLSEDIKNLEKLAG